MSCDSLASLSHRVNLQMISRRPLLRSNLAFSSTGVQILVSGLVRLCKTKTYLGTDSKSDAMGQRRPTGNIDEVFRPGLNVIRISESHARGYALFLTRLLRKAEELRSRAIQQSSSGVPELEVIIDEASDIFRASSRYLRDVATGILAEQIRKGRSLRTGYVIAVQSAGDVPENVRNNLNRPSLGGIVT